MFGSNYDVSDVQWSEILKVSRSHLEDILKLNLTPDQTKHINDIQSELNDIQSDLDVGHDDFWSRKKARGYIWEQLLDCFRKLPLKHHLHLYPRLKRRFEPTEVLRSPHVSLEDDEVFPDFFNRYDFVFDETDLGPDLTPIDFRDITLDTVSYTHLTLPTKA